MFFLKLFITSIFCDKVKSILRKHLSQSIHKLIISRGHKSVILNLKVLDQKYTKKSYFDPFQDFMTNLTCSFARQCSLRILLWSYNSNFTVYGRFCSPLIFFTDRKLILTVSLRCRLYGAALFFLSPNSMGPHQALKIFKPKSVLRPKS